MERQIFYALLACEIEEEKAQVVARDAVLSLSVAQQSIFLLALEADREGLKEVIDAIGVRLFTSEVAILIGWLLKQPAKFKILRKLKKGGGNLLES